MDQRRRYIKLIVDNDFPTITSADAQMPIGLEQGAENVELICAQAASRADLPLFR